MVMSIEWETPQIFFDTLNNEFHFDIDVCATVKNTKCEKYYSMDDNGLYQKWQGVCWMNPPYTIKSQKYLVLFLTIKTSK